MPYRDISASERIAILERQLAEARSLASQSEALMAENDRLKATVRELRAELRRQRGEVERRHAVEVEDQVRHLEQEELWDQAAGLLEHMVEASDDPARRRECLLRLARIQERRLISFEAARKTYQRILAENPFDDIAKGALLRVKRKLGRL